MKTEGLVVEQDNIFEIKYADNLDLFKNFFINIILGTEEEQYSYQKIKSAVPREVLSDFYKVLYLSLKISIKRRSSNFSHKQLVVLLEFIRSYEVTRAQDLNIDISRVYKFINYGFFKNTHKHIDVADWSISQGEVSNFDVVFDNFINAIARVTILSRGTRNIKYLKQEPSANFIKILSIFNKINESASVSAHVLDEHFDRFFQEKLLIEEEIKELILNEVADVSNMFLRDKLLYFVPILEVELNRKYEQLESSLRVALLRLQSNILYLIQNKIKENKNNTRLQINPSVTFNEEQAFIDLYRIIEIMSDTMFFYYDRSIQEILDSREELQRSISDIYNLMHNFFGVCQESEESINCIYRELNEVIVVTSNQSEEAINTIFELIKLDPEYAAIEDINDKDEYVKNKIVSLYNVLDICYIKYKECHDKYKHIYLKNIFPKQYYLAMSEKFYRKWIESLKVTDFFLLSNGHYVINNVEEDSFLTIMVSPREMYERIMHHNSYFSCKNIFSASTFLDEPKPYYSFKKNYAHIANRVIQSLTLLAGFEKLQKSIIIYQLELKKANANLSLQQQIDIGAHNQDLDDKRHIVFCYIDYCRQALDWSRVRFNENDLDIFIGEIIDNIKLEQLLTYFYAVFCDERGILINSLCGLETTSYEDRNKKLDEIISKISVLINSLSGLYQFSSLFENIECVAYIAVPFKNTSLPFRKEITSKVIDMCQSSEIFDDNTIVLSNEIIHSELSLLLDNYVYNESQPEFSIEDQERFKKDREIRMLKKDSKLVKFLEFDDIMESFCGRDEDEKPTLKDSYSMFANISFKEACDNCSNGLLFMLSYPLLEYIQKTVNGIFMRVTNCEEEIKIQEPIKAKNILAVVPVIYNGLGLKNSISNVIKNCTTKNLIFLTSRNGAYDFKMGFDDILGIRENEYGVKIYDHSVVNLDYPDFEEYSYVCK